MKINDMYVIKRNGEPQRLDMNKVHDRIKFLVNPTKGSKPEYKQYDLTSLSTLDAINVDKFAIKIVGIIAPDIKTSELDRFASIEAYNQALDHPQYEDLAIRLAVGNIQKNLAQLLDPDNLYLSSCRALANNTTDKGDLNPLISDPIMRFVEKYHGFIEDMIDYSRDYNFTYHGISLLENKYLSKAMIDGKRQIVESPQHMFMRVALGIWVSQPDDINKLSTIDNNIPDWDDIAENIYNTYLICSTGLATHATPTLFNAGRPKQQFSSCVLMGYTSDSISGIFNYFEQKAQVIKYACGVGSWVHNIRAQGTYIAGTDGYSNGVIPFLKISNEISVAIDQGGGKRPGSDANYIEVWHADIEKVLNLKLPTGNPKLRANDLFYALWTCDEFIRCLLEEERLRALGVNVKLWYLMCPHRCPNLYNVCDSVMRQTYIEDEELFESDKWEFTKLYRSYIKKGKYVKQISAIDLFTHISDITSETSIPYRCFKDTANRLSNQKNLGTIKSSNLCAEIYQYTDENEVAVCNLASICVNKFIENGVMNFDKIGEITYQLTLNINKIIDVSFYPISEMKESNLKHRPMGIGVQGLADAFTKLKFKFGSREAMELDFHIFETIYYWSLRASCDLAKVEGVYDSYADSPTAQNILQMDLCINAFEESDLKDIKEDIDVDEKEIRYKYNPIKFEYMQDWDTLRSDIAEHGLRNSLRTACMPTGSTSTIMGNSPAIEPHNAMIYKRTDSVGESLKYNRALVKTLIKRGRWNSSVLDQILQSPTGSIQDLDLPQDIKDCFPTAWDTGMLRAIMDHAAVRNPFIDQGQSMNLFIKDINTKILSQVLLYTWRRQLKTGSYYIRTLSKLQGKRTIATPAEKKNDWIIEKSSVEESPEQRKVICEEDVCIVCQS